MQDNLAPTDVKIDAVSGPNPGTAFPSVAGEAHGPKLGVQWREDASKVRIEFHYLDLMAGRLESQMTYIHQKQAIMFGLSSAMIAVMLYTGQNILAILPFFMGSLLAMMSIIPRMARGKKGVKEKNPFFYGTLPNKIGDMTERSFEAYGQTMLDNLHDLSKIIRFKNSLIGWSARFFVLGLIGLTVLAALGLVVRP